MNPAAAKVQPWKPLLEGDLAAAALDCAVAIAAELPAAISPSAPRGSSAAATPLSPALGRGYAGQALLYGYLSLHTGTSHYADRAIDLLDRAFEGAAALPLAPSLYSGFTGIAWAAHHLLEKFGEQQQDAGEEVDSALLKLLSRSSSATEYDLVNGLTGLGVYALERWPRPAAVRCLELVIERLGERAERSAEGAAWFSPPERLPDYQRREFPSGCYNLGAAHGAAGTLALLGGAWRAGIARARPLLEEVLRWLRARALPQEHAYRFPSLYSPLSAPRRGRLAWCHGELGIAATLAVGARAAELPAWDRTALDLALAEAQRSFEDSGVRDAGLCHGACGVAHLFNRLYQATGEERLADAARRWVTHSLELRQPGCGAAGFRTWRTGLTDAGEWHDDSGFLNGAAGVGLALLAAASSVAPDWDHALLTSLRPLASGAFV